MFRQFQRILLTVAQNDSSEEYPWRNPPKSRESEACSPRDDCKLPIAPDDPPDLRSPSSHGVRDSAIGPANRIAPLLQPPSRKSGEDSNSSNTSQSKACPGKEDSWEIDALVSFRVHHYFDYVAGTSTGG